MTICQTIDGPVLRLPGFEADVDQVIKEPGARIGERCESEDGGLLGPATVLPRLAVGPTRAKLSP